jgi:hypothetical protein
MPADAPFSYGSYLVPQDGSGAIYFDLVETEVITRDADITEFPVELGANITDHYRAKLLGIRLTCFVTPDGMFPELWVQDSTTAPMTISWAPYPTPSLLATIATAVVNPFGSIVRALTPSPTSATLPQVLQSPTQFDPMNQLLGTLDDLRNQAVLIDVATKSGYYAGFLFGQIETTRDKETGSATRLTIELKQIATVATQQVSAPPIPKKPKDKPPVSKGAQNPVPPGDMQSAASGILDTLKAAL